MNLFRKFTTLILFSLSLQESAHADTTTSLSLPEEGKEYTRLAPPLAPAPRVVEFLSFYCGPAISLLRTTR